MSTRANVWTPSVLLAGMLLAQPAARAEEALGELHIGGLGQAVETLELDRIRGGSDTVDIDIAGDVISSNQDAYYYGNLVAGNVAGDNYIGGAAFNTVNGMASVIQNSGNGVVIQHNTIVNIDMR